MLKKIHVLSIFCFSCITVFANNTRHGHDEKNPKDSSQNKYIGASRNAIKFNYLEANQRLSNSFYFEDNNLANSSGTIDSINTIFSNITSNNLWVSNITNNPNLRTPFGLNRIIDLSAYQIAFANITFTKDGAIARVFARVAPNGGANGALLFAGNINLSRIGGAGDNNVLNQVSTQQISFHNGAITLNIIGGTSNPSQFIFNCNGFTSLNLQCNVSLNSKTYFPVNSSFQSLPNTAITSNNFNVSINRWENLLKGTATFSNQTFGNNNIPDYFFNIQEATIDLSTLQNPSTGNTEITNYINKNVTTLVNTWVGVAITKMDVYLPAYFNNGNNRTIVKAIHGMIDDNGFTFRINNESNVLTLNNKAGSANGWPFTIDAFNIMFEKNSIVNAASFFTGKIVLPIEDINYANRGVPFTAQILQRQTNKAFELEVNAQKVDFITAKNFRGFLFTSSDDIELEFAIRNNTLFPKITFSGTFGMNSNRQDNNYNATEVEKNARGNAFGSDKEVAVKDVEFQDLVLQTETAPFLRIGYLGGGVEIEIGKHSAQITAEFIATGRRAKGKNDPNAACIHFDAAVQLAEGKFQGGVGIDLYCFYNQTTKTFEFEELRLGSVNIKADIGPAASIDGAIDIFNSREYGQGFSGQVILTVSKSLTVSAGIMFGSKPKLAGGRFYYFNIDASANFKPKGVIIFGCVKVTGFSGGVTYKMDAVPQSSNYPPTISGVSYKPNENSFLRLRAGIHFALADEKVFSGWGGLEFVFNQKWGLEEVNISGNAQLFSQPINTDKNKISPLMQARQQTYMTYKADAGEAVAERGDEITNTDGTKTFTNKKSSANYLVSTSTNSNNNANTIAEDTLSVAAQINIIRPVLDEAINDSIKLKSSLDAALLQQNNIESILAAMQRRSDSISNPKNSIVASQLSYFNGTNLSLINNLYHNSYKKKHPTEWQQISTLLNIPLIEEANVLNTRRANYTLPTQARINIVRDSLRLALRPNNSQSLHAIYNERVNFFTVLKDSAQYKELERGRIKNPISNLHASFGYVATNQPNSATINNNVRDNWRSKKQSYIDSITRYNNLRTALSNQTTQPIPIILILSDSINIPNVGWQPNFSITTNTGIINGINKNGTRFTVLNEATIYYNYYVNVLVPKFRVEDSIASYLQNVVKPIRDTIAARTAILNTTISNKRVLERTYFDTLLVINNYNNLVATTQNIKIRQLAGNTLTTAENIKLAEVNAAFVKVKPIINAFNIQNKKNQQSQLTNSLINSTNAIAAQRAIINSNTATINQKNAAQANLNNLLVQYRLDSSALAKNTLLVNGCAIFSYPGKLEMHQINKYVPTSFRNTDLLYANISKLETDLKQINKNIENIFANRTLTAGEINNRVTTEVRKKNTVQSDLNNEIKRALPVIAFSLLNTPEKASVDLFNYRNIATDFEPLSKSIDTAQAWLDRAMAFLEDSIVKANNRVDISSPEALGRSLAKTLRPADNPKFWGNFLLKIDIKNSKVKLEMDVYTSIDQQIGGDAVEVIKGDMNDFKLAGTLDLVISKDKFKLDIGTRAAPCKIEAAFGSFLTGKGSFYLGCSNNQTLTTNYSTNFNINFGIAAQITKGASVDIVVADLYAYLSGGISLDASVSRYENLVCLGENTNGFNGWYGTATFTAFVKAKVGVRNRFVDITLVSGGINASLTVAGPTPLYFRGTLNVYVNVLGINANHTISIEDGKMCLMQ